MKYLLAIVLLSICCSCGNNKKQQSATNSDSTATPSVADTRQFYKRFTGTIAGQPVTVYLQRSAAVLQGSYFYDRSGLPIQLINWQDSVRSDDSLMIYEWPLIDKKDDGSSHEWRVHLAGNKLTGVWINSINGKTYAIDLTENYTADNMQFDVLLISDTVRARPAHPEPYAYKSYQILIPAEKQQKTTFYNKIIGADLGCEGKDYTTCLKADMKPYFDDYLEGMVDFDTAESEMWEQMAYDSRYYKVTYNEQGWLILHSSFNTYMGGAHGMHGSAYINMDTKSERVWELKDILTADSVQLSPLLDRSIRKAYDLSATEHSARRTDIRIR